MSELVKKVQIGAAAVTVGALGIVGVNIWTSVKHNYDVSDAVNDRAHAVAFNHGQPQDTSVFTGKQGLFTSAAAVEYEQLKLVGGEETATKKEKMMLGCLALTVNQQPWPKGAAEDFLAERYTAGAKRCHDTLEAYIGGQPNHVAPFITISDIVG